MNKIIIPIAIIIAAVLISGVIVVVNQKNTSPDILSSQQVGEKVIKYINENVLAGEAVATLEEVGEENGVYKIKLDIEEQKFELYATKDGKLLFTQVIDLEEKPEEEKLTIGNFLVGQDEICKEDEKPIIYFFGSESCPHCQWEHPIVERVAKNFEGLISFHNNMDSSADMEIFSKYSEGSIPTLVFGCKYYRVGSGEQIGEAEESKILTALICKLTENQPLSVCDAVQDLINQIE